MFPLLAAQSKETSGILDFRGFKLLVDSSSYQVLCNTEIGRRENSSSASLINRLKKKLTGGWLACLGAQQHPLWRKKRVRLTAKG
jgi:hypothetical protein